MDLNQITNDEERGNSSDSDGFTLVLTRRERKAPKRLSLSGKKKHPKKTKANKGDQCITRGETGGDQGCPDTLGAPPKEKSEKMKGLIWNCRGIKKGVTSFLRNLILEHKFHVIGLQETMQENIDDGILRMVDPNQDYLWKWIPSRGKSGGMLNGINLDHFEVGGFVEGKYTLQLNLWDKEKEFKWNFVNVYGVAQEEFKNEFLTELAEIISKNKDPMLIGGDFNIIRYSSEKNKKGLHKHSGVFNSITNTYELIDLQMSGGRYTWSNNHEVPTLEMLHRFLVCKNWEKTFPLAMVYKLPRDREHSDHNPLILITEVKQSLRNSTSNLN
jgi:hypothetical protein